MKTLDISVIIPYYKSLSNIPNILGNLIRAGIEEDKITIIDDFSQDEVLKILNKNFSTVNYISNKKNRGAAYCRNLGIKKTNGEYILFLDSDIFFRPNELKKLLNINPSFDIIFPKIQLSNGEIMNPNNSWEKTYCMCSAAFLIRRKALEKFDEFFDEKYRIYGEDSDFFLRAKAFGLKFKYQRNSLFGHPKKYVYSEKTYYLITRNIVYLSLKLSGIIKYRMSFIKYLIGFTFANFLSAVLNRAITMKPFEISNVKYSSKPLARIRLLYYFFSAIFWNIKTFPQVLDKRKKLKRKIDKINL